jgi:hypothetical protein
MITMGAQEKHGLAFEARSLSKNHIAGVRHACAQAALDIGGNFVAG